MLNLHTHFTELKYRFFYIIFSFCLTFFFSYFYIDYIIYFFSIPLIKLKTKTTLLLLTQADFIFTNMFEAFNAYYFITFTLSLYFSIPVFLKIIFAFVKLGLQVNEKKSIMFVLNLFFVSCFISILFLYKILLPVIIKFFITFENISKTNLYTLKLEQKLFDYISLLIFFLIWCTIFFQIPLILILFLTKNIVNFDNLINHRRILLINFLIIGAILSPPEIYSQLLIAIPLSFLFEIIFFIYYVKMLYKLV